MSSAKIIIKAAAGAGGAPSGEAVFTNTDTVPYDFQNETYTFTVPDGVDSVSMIAIGGGGGGGNGTTVQGGGGGGGGALAYANNVSVTPGESLSIQVGDGGNYNFPNMVEGNGGNSFVKRGSTALVEAGGGERGGAAFTGNNDSGAGTVQTGTGNNGGNGGTRNTGAGGAGGGGAGGYTGTGGRGNNAGGGSGSAGSGGAGGGGGASNASGNGAQGGGVNPYGAGSSGGEGSDSSVGNGGGGGSGGQSGSSTSGGLGNLYGGGGGGSANNGNGQSGGRGVVRIIWGTDRTFPSTNVAEADSDEVYLNNVLQ